jgi:hypothetical protein
MNNTNRESQDDSLLNGVPYRGVNRCGRADAGGGWPHQPWHWQWR